MVDCSSFINEFLNIYPTLTKFQRKIFKYLHWFSKKFRCVFPCLRNIALALKCCTRTVIRSITLFESLGWLFKKKRGYCSNIYYLNDEIISLNLDDESIFLREKCHQNVTVLRSSSSDFIDICCTEEDVYPNKGEERDNPIPECIKISGLSPKEQQDLANQFSESDLVNAIGAARWYIREGNKIQSLIRYLWSAATNKWWAGIYKKRVRC